jgi:hypothetical protein
LGRARCSLPAELELFEPQVYSANSTCLAQNESASDVVASSIKKIIKELFRRGGGIMERSLAEVEDIVRDKICHVCADRTVHGNCSLEEPAACALFRLFPEVAKAIQSVQSDDINDYVQAIRQGVCSVCQEQLDGNCEERKHMRCALDAYLVLVVDAVEEATGRTFDRTDMEINRTAEVQRRVYLDLTNIP